MGIYCKLKYYVQDKVLHSMPRAAVTEDDGSILKHCGALITFAISICVCVCVCVCVCMYIL
jgi:hypothetical protein